MMIFGRMLSIELINGCGLFLEMADSRAVWVYNKDTGNTEAQMINRPGRTPRIALQAHLSMAAWRVAVEPRAWFRAFPAGRASALGRPSQVTGQR